jgi:death on curing protein
MKYLSVSKIQYVAHKLAQELLEWGEPIPDFSTRYPQKLEGCLGSIKQTFAKKELYPTLHKKAAALFYFMIKDHPFQNGNKRVAVMTMIYFLHINGQWLKIDNQMLYNFAKWVAESDPILKGQTIESVEVILKKFTIKRNN